MATSLDDFLPMVRGRLPGCPDIILRDAVRDTCIAFCKRTRLFTESVSVDVIAGESAIELYPDEGVQWEILAVRRDQEPLMPIAKSEFVTLNLDVYAGTPKYYYLAGDRNLVVGPIPDRDETLSALVTLRPSDTTSQVNDALYGDFREPIAAGARAWVRRNHGDWANSQLEMEDRLLFDQAINAQNIRRARGGADAPLRVRIHPF